ncbi:MAG: GWxTD domain-containing protein [Bryobacteraceae bacterium]
MLRKCPLLPFVVFVVVSHAVAAKSKLPKQYDKWLNQEVVYIITDEERKAFLQLLSDGEREKFIQDFWDVRNPLRGSLRNPYKDEIYRRIEYANEHFGRMTNTPGWMTDMGRAYIVLGKPVSAHPFVGYGQIYPLELWSYSNETGNPSLPPFFNLLFFQPEDIEEYRFYRPYTDGPLKLVRGSNFNTNADVYRFLMPLGGDVAHAAFSLIPNDPIDKQSFRPELSSDMLVGKVQNFANDSFNLRKLREMRALREHVSSHFLLAQDQPLKLEAFVIADPSGQYWLDYAVAVDRAELGVVARNGSDLNLRIDYRLTTGSGALIVEDSEERAYPAFETGTEGRHFVPFQVTNRLPMVAGDFRLEVQIVNPAAGKSYKGTLPVSIQAPVKVKLNGPLLASEAAKVELPDGFMPFEYFGARFRPSASRTFVNRGSLTVLYELEKPAADAAGCTVDYVFANVQDRAKRRLLTDSVAAADFRDGRLLKSKTIPLAGFEPGEYSVVLTVRQSEGGPALASANVPLKLVNDQPPPGLFVSPNSHNVGRRGVSFYIRALEAAAQKDEKSAVVYMKRALDQNPANDFASEFLVQVYFRQRNYEGVADLYHRVGLSPFKNSSHLLAQIGLSCWEIGQKTEARKVLTEAKNYFPDDSTLKTTAHALESRR